MWISSHHRLSLSRNRTVIIRVQIIYPLVFTDSSLRDRKAVIITHPSKNVPSHHFRTIVILVIKIIIRDGDAALCWLAIFGA